MRILFLDDDQERYDRFKVLCPYPFYWAKTADEAIQFLSTNECDYVFLDHDLEGVYQDSTHENTGAAVARWMAAYWPSKHIPVIIHSWNPPGAEKMHVTLKSGGFQHIRRAEFNSSLFKALISVINTRYAVQKPT